MGMLEFDTHDLLQLLNLPPTQAYVHEGECTSRFKSRGPSWRKEVVKALTKRSAELDLLALRKAPVLAVDQVNDAAAPAAKKQKREAKDLADLLRATGW